MLAWTWTGVAHALAAGLTVFAGGIQMVARLSSETGWLRPELARRSARVGFFLPLTGAAAVWLIPHSGAARILLSALSLIGGAEIILPRWTRWSLEGLPARTLNLAILALYLAALLTLGQT